MDVQYVNFASKLLKVIARVSRLFLIIVPQLSKCLKFEVIRGDQIDQRIRI